MAIPDTMRPFDDPSAVRKAIYDTALEGVQKRFPIEDDMHKLELVDARYNGPQEFTLEQQKQALLKNRILQTPITGKWRLTDKKTGQVLDEREDTVMNVPYYSGRGTFVHRGNEYSMCLHGSTQVWTELGIITIQEIVKNRMAIRVWSYDFNRAEFVLKPVVNWYTTAVPGLVCTNIPKQNARAGYDFYSQTSHTPTCLWSTPEHKILNADGSKVLVADATTGLLACTRLSYAQRQLMYGSLLGDATIDLSSDCLRFAHCEKQREYLEYKHDIFGVLSSPLRQFESHCVILSTDTAYHAQFNFHVKTHPEIREAAVLCYPSGIKTVTRAWLDRVDAAGLAFWFADDGSARRLGRCNMPIITLSTQGFDNNSVALLVTWLGERFGLRAYANAAGPVKQNGEQGQAIHLHAEHAMRFLEIVAPYLPECVRYKFLDRPSTRRCKICGQEIQRVRNLCSRCVAQHRFYEADGHHLSKTFRMRFPGVNSPDEAMRRLADKPEDFGSNRWDAMQADLGSKVNELRADNAYNNILRPVPLQLMPPRGMVFEKVRTAYDLEVEGTHNYFANGLLVSNSHQSRLKPGAYVRRQKSGDVETHFNVLPGTGKGFRIQMDPATGVFKLNIGQSDIPLYTLLQNLQVSDKTLADHWGADLLERNMAKSKPTDLAKVYERFSGYKYDPQLGPSEQAAWLKENLPQFKLDPDVIAATLGIRNAAGVTPDLLLRATQKMLNVSKGTEDPDERDSLLYASIHGPEDLIRERIDKDAGKLTKNMLFRLRRAKNLQPIRKGIMDSYISSLMLGSGLTQPLEETNPLSTLEQMVRITKLGEGGIGSAEAVTDEARNVSNTQAGFIDPIVGPESEAVGVDVRAAYGTYKGRDHNIYGEFRNAASGKSEYLNPAQVYTQVLAYPGELQSDKKVVTALSRGKIVEVPRESVTYEIPTVSHMFSPNTNLNPMPTSVQSARQFYGSKFWSQYMPMVKGEVPLVDSVMDDGRTTFTEHYGRKIGTLAAARAGIVTRVDDTGVTVVDRDGEKKIYETVKDYPFNRLTALSYTPVVKVGDKVNVGDMIAHSNFTDPKTGAINMGVNLKTAIIPAKGGSSYEDAYSISASAAKRLATERLYGFDEETRHDVSIDRNQYLSLFPRNFTKEQMDKIGDDGIVKPGTILNQGDPIILATGPKLLTAADAQLGKLHKALRNTRTDKVTTWDYAYPGIVTDAVMMQGGARVNVKSQVPVQPGDKLCYDPETEVLTRLGWKHFNELTLEDKVASLDPETGKFEYIAPVSIQRYDHVGKMYKVSSQQLDLCVTDNHKLFVQRRHRPHFEFLEPGAVFGKLVSHKKDGQWEGTPMEFVTIPGVPRGHRWGPIDQPDLKLPVDTYMMLLGMFLSEGNCVDNANSASYAIEFTQIKEESAALMIKALTDAGFKDTYAKTQGKFRIYSKSLLQHFKQFGHAHDKFIPDWVFELPVAQLRVLFDWLMWGDGHCIGKRPVCYTTVSPRLANDVQRLCLHIGYAANVNFCRVPAGHQTTLRGRIITARYDICDVRIVTTKLTPVINHSHVKTQKAQSEQWIDYTGEVWCCTLPKWHTLYVRRNGKPIWCGNSTRFGLKGVTGRILDDDQMPRDPVTNEPYELVLNPMGVLSRVAAGQVIEMALGKVAKQTGKQFRLPQNPPKEGWATWASNQLAAAGVSDKADIFDPETGKTIKGVGDGYIYMSAFHHLADKKLSARGESVGYTMDQQPAKGGSEGAKRFSMHDVVATLSHGAPEVLRDMTLIRGSRNDDYWKAMKLGMPLPEPKQPFIYDKFLATMKAAGINLTEKGSTIGLLPMTDKAVEAMSKGSIAKADMVDDDFDPVPGGLFDPGKTGGTAGNRWTHIDLATPVPNPVMEEPIRRLLGLTKEGLRDVIAGRKELDGLTGGLALKAALGKIDIDNELEFHKNRVNSVRGSNRDNSIKLVGYLAAAKKQGLHPADWMITKVPVLPPQFRPVARLGSMALVPDINELYRDTISINNSIRELRKEVGEKSLGEEYETLYDSVAAAYGLGEAITPEGASKRLKGAFRQIVGNSPKSGLYQSKVLSKTVDVVARGVMTPEPSYDMDQAGIPEDAAWALYKDFTMRKLTQRGFSPVRSLELIEKRAPEARTMLDEVMRERPVIADRAPTWHKFNFMGFWPHIVDGKTFRMNPLVTKGYTLDFNGDSVCNTHISVIIKGKFHYITLEKLIDTAIIKGYTEDQALSLLGKQTAVFQVKPGTIKVLGLMEDGNTGYVNADFVSIHTSHGPDCYRVQTTSGLDSVFTAHHNFWKLNDACELEAAKTTEIDVGSLVPYCARFDIPVSRTSFPAEAPFRGELDYDAGFLMGHYFGDGGLTGRDDTVSFASSDPQLRDHINTLGTRIFGMKSWIEGNGKSVRWTSKPLYNWFASFGKGAAGKLVPSWMLSAPHAFRHGLIAGFFAAEASYRTKVIRVESVNRDMLVQFKFLLESTGAVVRLREGKEPKENRQRTWFFEVTVATLDTSVFNWPECATCSKFTNMQAATRHNWDIVPVPKDIAVAITQRGQEFVCGGGAVRAARIRAPGVKVRDTKRVADVKRLGMCTRTFAKNLILWYALDSLESEAVKRWVALVNNQTVMWERVKSIEKAERPDVTYDFTIAGKEAFAVDGTHLTHNTMNFHVPASDAAVKQVKEKMMASKNLFSLTDLKSARHTPTMEMSIGLYRLADKPTAKPIRTFATVAEAKAAYRRGDIDANDPVDIKELR